MARVVALALLAGSVLVAVGAQGATAESVERSAAERCSEFHRFGAQPVDVAKTGDGQTALAQVRWGYHESIGCFLALDDDALAALRGAGPPGSLPGGETDDSRRCFEHHRFGAEPVDVAKTVNGQTVLARLSWGYDESIGCYLTLDSAAINTLRAADLAATAEPSPAEKRIEWTNCGSNLECGSLDVPADYRSPEADTIKIAVNVLRTASPEQRIGYLLVNPGGPGGSGVELVASGEGFADQLLERFDIVGFDPRGVGESEPAFSCGASGEQLKLLAAIDMPIDSPDDIAAGEAAANLCIQSMGPVGGLLHSEYVARDMDEIRKALGADQISYLGFSYGSTLGVWYATLFPQSVRAMAVDGADNPVDPASTRQERIEEAIEEVAPFADSLDQALAACDDWKQCPIYNRGNPVAYFREAVTKLDLVNQAANGNPRAGGLGVLTTLYSQDYWPYLWQGLYRLRNNDPSVLLEFALLQLGEDPAAASFTEHVNCLDSQTLYPELDRDTLLADAEAAEAVLEERFPLLALMFPPLPSACLFYDQFAPDPLQGPLDGGNVPILVIGNHSDPATPFGESEELATDTLTNGYLIETSHITHVVYPNNECVNHHIHQALINLVYPDERRVVCESQK
ncbi:alpha/beta fold hydrolase [Candidatus Poriferisocius sp.]|uniref:alpha/beta fold hydrolase n=1 Tax=Candidatus Poriferisocius sp. TaxID=3101276 RepID=UPI003B02565F